MHRSGRGKALIEIRSRIHNVERENEGLEKKQENHEADERRTCCG